MQTLSKTYAWNICVNVCEKNLFYVPFSMFRSCLLMFCWRKRNDYSDVMISQRCTECLLPLAQLIVDGQKYGGETATIHVYMFTQGHSKMWCLFFFHSLCKLYLPYSGFYCGIIQSGIIIQYCTILFLLTKQEKVKKKIKNKSKEKKLKL